MVDFNPGAPDTIGNEFLAAGTRKYGLGANLGVGIVFTASASESIRYIARWLNPRAGGRKEKTTALAICDVYDATDIFVNDASYSTLAPGSLHAMDAAWDAWTDDVTDDGPAVPLSPWTYVDETVLLDSPATIGGEDFLSYTPATSGENIITFHGAATGTWLDFLDGSSVGDPSGRIQRLTLEVVVASNAAAGATVDGMLHVAKHLYSSDTGPVVLASRGGLIRVRYEWRWNPSNGLEWTADDVTNFQATPTALPGVFGLKVTCPVGTGTVRVYALKLVVASCTEKRLATCVWRNPLRGRVYNARILDPADYSSTDWSKASGTPYWLAFHLGGDGGQTEMTSLNGTNIDVVNDTLSAAGSTVLPDWVHASLPYRSLNAVPIVRDLMGGFDIIGPDGPTTDLVATNETPNAVLLDTSAVASVDSMPYASSLSKTVKNGQTWSQEIPDANGTYGVIAVTARTTKNSGVLEQIDPLVLTVKRSSDDAVLLGPASIQPNDIPYTGRFQRIRASVTPGSVTVPCYIEASSSDLVGWRVVEYETLSAGRGTPHDVDDATYGGFASAALDNGVSLDSGDMVGWALQVVPSAPTITADIATQANLPTTTGTTNTAAIHYATLSCSSGVGSPVYEIQRLNPADSTWHSIAFTDGDFSDFEVPRGIEATYRARVENTAGFSGWSDEVTVTIPTDACQVILASNALPAFSFGCIAPTPSQWQLPEADRVTFVYVDGRDAPVGFREIERSGDTFTVDLQIAFDDAAIKTGGVRPGRTVFEAAVGLLHNPELPYVAVCDWDGNVWYTSPQIQQLERVESRGHYHMTVKFTAVSLVPFPVALVTP